MENSQPIKSYSIFISCSESDYSETAQHLSKLIEAESEDDNRNYHPYRVSFRQGLCPVEAVIDQADLVVILYSSKYNNENEIHEADLAARCGKALFVVYLNKDELKLKDEGSLLATIFANSDGKFYLFNENDELAMQRLIRRIRHTLLTATQLRLLNAPQVPSWYETRSPFWEDVFGRNLRRACCRPGIVIVFGPEGSGKTSLISAFLHEPSYQNHLRTNCQVKNVIWMNCFKWHDRTSFNMNPAQMIRSEMKKVWIKNGSPTPNLIIFDDVSNTQLLEELYKFFRLTNIPLCIVTDNQFVENHARTLKTRVGEIFYLEIPEYSEKEVLRMVDSVQPIISGNKFTLSIAHRIELAKRCRGLPRNVVASVADLSNRLSLQSSKYELEHAIRSIIYQSHQQIGSVDSKDSGELIKSGSAKGQPSIRLFGVPYFEQYYRRKEVEFLILKAIEKLTREPSANKVLPSLLITGLSGIGKSTLISSIIHNPEYRVHLGTTCNLQIVFWFDCGDSNIKQISHEFLKMALQEFPDRKWASLAEMFAYFMKKKHQRILVILDDLVKQDILCDLQKACPFGLFLAILRDYQHTALSEDCGFHYEMPPLNEKETTEILETLGGLKDKLAPHQIHQLVLRLCNNGLPFNCKLVAAQFYRWKWHHRKYDDLLAIHEEMCWSVDDEDVVEELFDKIFHVLYGNQVDCFISLLLFYEAHQPIKIAEIAILWACAEKEMSDLLANLEDLSLLQRATASSVTHPSTVFYIHPLLHDIATKKVLYEFKMTTLDELRQYFALNLIPGGNLLQLLCQAFEADQFDLLCRMIMKLPNFDFSEHSFVPAQKTQDSKGRTMLMAAAKYGTLSLVKALHEGDTGAIEARDQSGWCALTWAVKNSGFHVDILEYLFNEWPKAIDLPVDSRKKTVLTFAAEQVPSSGILAFLLEKGPSQASQFDVEGKTPLMTASMVGNQPAVNEICRRFPEQAQQLDQKDGRTAFSLACEYGHVDVARSLYQVWPEVVTTNDRHGDIAMIWACRGGNLDVIRFLHEIWPNGLLVSGGKRGKSALREALDSGHPEAVTLLYQLNKPG